MRKFAVVAGVLAVGAAMQAQAVPLLTSGAGSVVDTADRTATFNGLASGHSLNPYTEGGLVLRANDVAYTDFDADGASSQFSGGYFYADGGINGFYALTTSLSELMFGVEFALGSGYFSDLSDGNSSILWQTYRGGLLTGSGSGLYALGTIVGIGDDDGFDRLLLANDQAGQSINALAMDNLRVDLSPVSVPEPGTLALFGLGLVGLAAMRRRRAA